jgi:predicted Fe-S protein YdhL (DUF1289 family)
VDKNVSELQSLSDEGQRCRPGATRHGVYQVQCLLAQARQVLAGQEQLQVPSPCRSVCRIDERSGLCSGCCRTLDEIAQWSQTSASRKREVWRCIQARLSDDSASCVSS